MDDNEKHRRCINAPMIYSEGGDHCKVYGRTIGPCSDCAFSTTVRPAYLRKMGVIE